MPEQTEDFSSDFTTDENDTVETLRDKIAGLRVRFDSLHAAHKRVCVELSDTRPVPFDPGRINDGKLEQIRRELRLAGTGAHCNLELLRRIGAAVKVGSVMHLTPAGHLLNDSINRIEKGISENTRKIEELDNEYKETAGRLNAALRLCSEYEQAFGPDPAKALAEIGAERAENARAVDTLNATLRSQRADLLLGAQKISELRHTIEVQAKDLASVREKHGAAVAERDALQVRVDALRESSGTIRTDLDNANQSIRHMSEHVKSLQHYATESDKSAARLTAELDDAQTKLAVVTDERDGLARALSLLEAQHAGLREAIKLFAKAGR